MVFNEVDALKLNMEGNLSVAIEWRRLQARRRITSWWTRTVAIVAVVADRWFRNRPFNHIINRCVYWFVNQLVIDASISHFQELVRQDRRELSLVERRLIYQTLFNRDIGKKKNKCFFSSSEWWLWPIAKRYSKTRFSCLCTSNQQFVWWFLV